MSEIKKLSYDSLCINVTRRCNMRPICAHCLRGEPQNVDLSKDTVDNFLNQTEMIEALTFSGGEPFLNVDIINYFLNEIKRRGIPLYRLNIITNGIIPPTDIKDTIAGYHDYIQKCRANPYNRYRCTNPKEPIVQLSISVDTFHGIEKGLMRHREYSDTLSNIATICFGCNGLIPSNIGNAKRLSNKDKVLVRGGAIRAKQIAIVDKDHKPNCIIFRTWWLTHPDQIIVCCPVQLSARGFVLPNTNDDTLNIYDEIDKSEYKICSVHGNIYQNILDYNDRIPLDCLACASQQDRASADVEYKNSINEYIKHHMKEVILFKQLEEYDFNNYRHNTSDIFDKEEDISVNSPDVPPEKRIKILDDIRRRSQNYDYTFLHDDVKDYWTLNLNTQKYGNTIANMMLALNKSKRLNDIRKKVYADNKKYQEIWNQREEQS